MTPYINFHCPCFFPQTITDDNGKGRKKYRYKDMKTPYEKFKSILDASQYIKACVTFEQMNAQAAKISDNEAALALNNARKKLYKDISALIRKQA